MHQNLVRFLYPNGVNALQSVPRGRYWNGWSQMRPIYTLRTLLTELVHVLFGILSNYITFIVERIREWFYSRFPNYTVRLARENCEGKSKERIISWWKFATSLYQNNFIYPWVPLRGLNYFFHNVGIEEISTGNFYLLHWIWKEDLIISTNNIS